MRRIRQLHLYAGTLFTPAIILFVVSGFLQTLGLHEAKRGVLAHPPGWIEMLAEIHKNQRLRKPTAEPAVRVPNSTQSLSTAQMGSRSPKPSSLGSSRLLFKIFVTIMSVGLISTTCLGVVMAFKYSRNKWLVWTVLGLGAAIPLVLLCF
jgi:hypothetical protein